MVTFEVGVGGRVRKTPFLNVGKAHSRARLIKFVDEIGMKDVAGFEDEFLVRAQDEKTDVVTAVNHSQLPSCHFIFFDLLTFFERS